MRMKISPAALALLLLAALAFAGCSDVLNVVATVLEQSGDSRLADLAEVARKGADAAKEITPEEEYYLGRAVAAMLFSSYRSYEDADANSYVNKVGQLVAQASDMPATRGGYHFLILDTDEVNAFAAPGGLILVTRGLLNCCKSEDEVAAVLAHEVAHVQFRHGVGAIKQSRWKQTASLGATKFAKNFTPQQFQELTTLFAGSVTDVVGTLTVKGYSRSEETDADAAAVKILKRAGYDPGALGRVLAEMKAKSAKGGGMFSTHPSPDDRLAAVSEKAVGLQQASSPAHRQPRYAAALGKI